MKPVLIFFAVLSVAIVHAACRSVILVPGGEATDDEDPQTDGSTDTDGTDSASCAPADIDPLVCLDFEVPLDGATTELNGTVALDTDVVYRGQTSLRAETVAENAIASLRSTFQAIDTGTVYFRVLVFLPAGMATGNIKILNLSSAGEPPDEENRGVDVNISGDLGVNIYQHGNFARFESAPGLVPEDEWFCLRGSYSISTTSGATMVWINDLLVVSTTASEDAIINGGVSEFETGIGWTEGGQVSALLYVDDVVVAVEPIPCI